jgi:arsenite methyltransferase
LTERDPWAAWFAERRHGGNDNARLAILDALAPVRERVLAGARLEPGDKLLDAGCGDGLIGFGALELVGEDGSVIFEDISEELLDRCREVAGDDPRCSFVNASLTDLPLPDESVDAATVRSVVIYVPEKQRAFGELHRVLKPGGRLSLFEPLNSFAYPERDETFLGIEVGDLHELSDRVKAVWRSIDIPEFNSMHDWDERDLAAWVDRAGFRERHLEAAYEVKAMEPWDDYDVRSRQAGNPLAPSLAEAIDQALAPEEAERFVTWLRAHAAAGNGVERSAVAYLTATK